MTMFAQRRKALDFAQHAIDTGSHPSSYVPVQTLPAITPYLKKYASILKEATSEMTQDEQKTKPDKNVWTDLLLVTRCW